MNRLKDKVCIVTGAALGIGRASCRLMAAEGARVVVADIDLDAAETTAAEIRDQGGKALALRVDATDNASIAAMVEAARAHYGRIDVLYNNVGFTDSTRDTNALDMDWDYWSTVVQLNLGSTVYATRCVLPTMIEQGGGVIINTASMAAVHGMHQPTAYAATKAGVPAFSRSVAVQYGAKGIRCNTIAPGLILTTRAVNWPQPLLDAFLSHTPVGRLGQPEDIGHLAVFLASEESRYITGQLFQVDGGVGIQSPMAHAIQSLTGKG